VNEIHESRSERDTEQIAERLAAELLPGTTILLHGELGAGKTTFVRGLASGIGVDPARVSSPTFTLIQEYRGRVPLYHVDLYRISGAEADDLGLEELFAGGGLVAVEWAEKLSRPPDRAIEVRLADAGEGIRTIAIQRG